MTAVIPILSGLVGVELREAVGNLAMRDDWLDRHATAAQKARWSEGNRLFPIETAGGAGDG